MEELFYGKASGASYKHSVPPPDSAPDSEKKDFVLRELARVYTTVFKPIEEATRFDVFYSSALNEAEFRTPPMVLLVGPYSVGKTSFIHYLLGRSFPGERIGPEPTTDRFCAVMYGQDERTIPGNALTVAPNSPFRALQREGNNFLSRFEGSMCCSPLLEHITLIDTPGVLSGEKQRVARNYDFDVVVQWFAERVDLIILLFDPFKLDISDELMQVIKRFKGHEDKVRVVLNKADLVSQQQLMRVYGALMWSLGKVLETPEVCRVYVGSFHDEELKEPETAPLLAAEMQDLLNDLRELPHQSALRRVNELVKRARLLRAHTYLLDHLREQMPAVYGFEKKKAELLETMAAQFRAVNRARGLSPGDFPDMAKFVAVARELDFTQFPRVGGGRMRKGKALEGLEIAMEETIPKLMEYLPRGDRDHAERVTDPPPPHMATTEATAVPSVEVSTAEVSFDDEGTPAEADEIFANEKC
ncbi:P-loop containing nucleoside triphosphate hydrolase protein [Pelagophyceae sp. CCMP2097]|nr:P-loop containing nucleoside triphosphate hydrolase protein [Pelagophyceae sp. CCMP2097]|mmetsp:Transcript_9841/g.32454  ORF Transcript_9841/g.32454 Transcript_9841/m.32454 type:complete len:473 (-) Transcript_9841:138-1556(-)